MKYPYCCAIAAIIYNGSFNATSGGPLSADKFASEIAKLDQEVVKAAEAQLTQHPELFGPYASTSESGDEIVEAFAMAFDRLLGIT